MPVNPINSVNVSFGKKNKEKKQTALLPGALAGAAGGMLYANLSKIKFDKNNLENTYKNIGKELSMSETEKDSFIEIKSQLDNKLSIIKAKYKKMKITPETKEISVQDLLNGIVYDPNNKSFEKLNDEINWVQGEINSGNFSQESLLSKTQALDEKLKMKTLIETSQDNKIEVSKIKEYYESTLRNDNRIKSGIESVSSFVKSFNKRRIGMYGVIGLVAGGVIGNMIKINSNKNEEKK